jgi:hypothetical protein
MAAMCVMSNDLFMKDVPCFNNTCSSLNFSRSDGFGFLPADLSDIMWGCSETRLLLGDEVFKHSDWSHDVRRYIGMAFSDQGILRSPTFLSFTEFDPDELDAKNTALGYDELMASAYQSKQESTLSMLELEVLTKLNSLLSQVSNVSLKNGDGGVLENMRSEIYKQIQETQKEVTT